MNLSQLEKRLDSVESHRQRPGGRDSIWADIESMSSHELDQLLTNLFIVEAGALWEQTDCTLAYGAILQQIVDENMAEFPNFPAEAWPPLLLEMFERHGVKISN